MLAICPEYNLVDLHGVPQLGQFSVTHHNRRLKITHNIQQAVQHHSPQLTVQYCVSQYANQ